MANIGKTVHEVEITPFPEEIPVVTPAVSPEEAPVREEPVKEPQPA